MKSDRPSISGLLKSMIYPGRFIVIGMESSENRAVVVYGVTGRSPSSQARKMMRDGNGVWVRPTSEKIVREGRLELLIYPAVLFSPGGITVTNGRQTEAVSETLRQSGDVIGGLARALEPWDYEPDHPTYTPRISGFVGPDARAGLSILKRGQEGESLRHYFDCPLRPGKAYLISTYSGDNRDPLPAFGGEPRAVGFDFPDARAAAEEVYESLGPAARASNDDFRVAAAVVFAPPSFSGAWDVRIINRSEREAS